MGWIDRLNLAQRVVVVVTIGLTLGAVANYLTGLGTHLTGLGTGSGWYAYSPLAGQVLPPSLGEPGWLRLVIWLAAIGLWAVTSLRVLAPGRS